MDLLTGSPDLKRGMFSLSRGIRWITTDGELINFSYLLYEQSLLSLGLLESNQWCAENLVTRMHDGGAGLPRE